MHLDVTTKRVRESKTTFISIAQFWSYVVRFYGPFAATAKVSHRVCLELWRSYAAQWIVQLIFDSKPPFRHGHFGNSGFYSGIWSCKTMGKTMTVAKPSITQRSEEFTERFALLRFISLVVCFNLLSFFFLFFLGKYEQIILLKLRMLD